MRRIIVLTEKKKKIDQKWLAKLQVLFPECQIKVQSKPSENKCYPIQSRQDNPEKINSKKKKRYKLI